MYFIGIIPVISVPPLLEGTSQSNVTLLLVTSGALRFCGADGGAKYMITIIFYTYFYVVFSIEKLKKNYSNKA